MQIRRVMRTLSTASVAGILAVASLGGAGCTTATRAPMVTRADRGDIEALRARFANDARFSKLKGVDVDPRRGVVTLSGRVSTTADRADAGALASSVKGVAIVYNELEVERTPR